MEFFNTLVYSSTAEPSLHQKELINLDHCFPEAVVIPSHAVKKHLSENLDYHVLIIGNYLAIYRVEANSEVSIIRVFHGARNYHKILRDMPV